MSTISREAAVKEIARWTGYIDEDMILRIQTGLKKLPSVQPEPQKAIWALRTYMPHHYYCTHCKKDSPYNKTWSHCPNCGFEMEGYV